MAKSDNPQKYHKGIPFETDIIERYRRWASPPYPYEQHHGTELIFKLRLTKQPQHAIM